MTTGDDSAEHDAARCGAGLNGALVLRGRGFMLAEGLAAIAAAGAGAVVQAAGTDAWETVRDRVRRIFGAHQERTVTESLDHTSATLQLMVREEDRERELALQAAFWRLRFEELLAGSEGERRQAAAAQLLSLGDISEQTPASRHTFTGNVSVRADRGSVAGAVFEGDVHIENPRSPGRSQG
ncbi:hypothetical protein ACIQMY_06950 [Streptomyces sp. NPDC091368]|uniref:hypothetical protein n=1 Tax=Streptomyces sp. NPDC091368 TaxID=3365993 RepID=UPI0038082298